MMAGQLAVRMKGSSKCSHHKTEDVVFVCREDGCNNDLACVKCVTTIHKKHDLENIATAVKEKKTRIQDFVRTFNEQGTADIDLVIQATKLKLLKNSEKFKTIRDQMKTHAEECKAEIDKVLDEFLFRCSKEEDENKGTLTEYKEELLVTKAKMISGVKNCQDILQKGTDIQIYDMDMDIVEGRVTIPDTPTMCVIAFTECDDYKQCLRSAFGDWKYMDEKYQAQLVIRPA